MRALEKGQKREQNYFSTILERSCPVLNCGKFPVLDVKDDDAAARMQDHEVGIARLGLDRDIAPAEVVVFQQFL